MAFSETKPERTRKRIFVKDLNDVLICNLCNGYLIDATTLIECLHVFCRGCILRHFENSKTGCPSCNTIYKKKNQPFFRADPQIQALVYKMVPGLYSKEMQRREDFYRSTGVRASSSCSDDSVLERERDLINDQEDLISSYVGDKSQFFGPEDYISLSLEYYRVTLDTTPLTRNENSKCDVNGAGVKHKTNGKKDVVKDKIAGKGEGDQRFLQCPAGVSMKHLQKFVRMKYALTSNHRVDIIYEGEVLPSHFSLMDVAYSFKWKRVKPMKFFYRIFTPLKVQPIQPIKIVNTTLSTGGKQLQIVKARGETSKPIPLSVFKPETLETKNENEEKERLLANLQLQSRAKVQKELLVPEKVQHTIQDCVFEYEEPDKEEIKRFAEIRDREWALQKKLDESRDEEYHHTKKRKKNKHSKNDFAFKKRKLHAEITNKEEELKLKVKLTPHNGHKHKHHKSSAQAEVSSKEKLLQMRQVRHKHVSSEDKNIQTIASGSVIKETGTETTVETKPKVEVVKEKVLKPVVVVEELKSNGVITKKVEEVPKKIEVLKKVEAVSPKTVAVAKPINKEWGKRVATVQLERNEQTEQQAKRTFQSFAEKYQQKNAGNKESVKPILKSAPPIRAPSQLERKIANLQQRCTIETKPLPQAGKLENKINKVLSPQCPPGFTVSKIESGAKRKSEEEVSIQDKRPSLEITLINPPEVKTKRPPPATIPLERIKKSIGLKSGISIIPKVPPEKCDNIGALDLSSKPTKGVEGSCGASPTTPAEPPKPVNGFSSPKETKNVNMSNLQMLSKVATEHLPTVGGKPRPQLPNLQTLKIPQLQNSIAKMANLQKQLPKLTEINKTHYKLMNPPIRNLRPNQNQNQNIRNIPNPSLLVRQQNQNRLISMNQAKENSDKGGKLEVTPTTITTTTNVSNTNNHTTSVSVVDTPKITEPPKPVAVVPKQVASVPKPVAAIPKPVAVVPKPVAVVPKPVAVVPNPVVVVPKLVPTTIEKNSQ